MAIQIILPFLLLQFLNFHELHAQIPPNISLGTSITAGSSDSWRSLSDDFAFGFYSLPNNLYLVGIWFNKIPERTLVWSANRDSPAAAGSTVRLTFDGQLTLTHLNGSVELIYRGRRAALGFMENDGNFVLRDDSSDVVWESFSSPTDTILPGQNLSGNQKLYSNANGTVDYSTGNFMLEMQYDGNLVLSAYHFSDPGYWYSGTLTTNVSLVFNNDTASMYLVNSTGNNIYTLTGNVSTPVGDYYYRATINDHGNFQQLAYHKSNSSGWTRLWRAIDEPCVNAICGVNGMCFSQNNETSTCRCIPGYIPLDPNHVSKGCRPETVVNYCADPSMKNFTIEVIDDADFPFESFADLARVKDVDLEGCKKALMDDCDSLAASLVDSRCIKKRMPLLNARKSFSTKGIQALVKVPMKSSPGIPEHKKRNDFDSRVFLKISVIVTATLAFFFGVSSIYYHPAPRRLIRRKRYSNANSIGINFQEFKYMELQKATNGFSKALGRGSSAKVYSGILSIKDMHIDIAVKVLEKSIEKGEKEFMTELKIIGRTYHRNLVRLLGFCVENNQQHLLVYELMSNGSLANLLFGKGSERPNWVLRAEMVLEIARGLLYLHEECETQIIHCDIKPENVLVDNNFTAKLADFGLSKLLNKDQTRTDTNLRGTVGYLAPEWIRNERVTSKVDVYSFGVMLLEIICCRRHIDPSRVEEESEEDDLVLSDWVISCMAAGKLETVVGHDPEVLSDFERFERMALVGLWCIHPDAMFRPSMKKVTQMLEGTLEIGIPPSLSDQMSVSNYQ